MLIDEIGEKIAKSIIDYFSKKENILQIEDLKLWITIKSIDKNLNTSLLIKKDS